MAKQLRVTFLAHGETPEYVKPERGITSITIFVESIKQFKERVAEEFDGIKTTITAVHEWNGVAWVRNS